MSSPETPPPLTSQNPKGTQTQTSHRAPNALAQWNGFLPKGSILMAQQLRAPLAPALEIAQTDTLQQIARDLEGCTRCKLCNARKNIVLGEGNPAARLMFIGEGPGEEEDQAGRPFIGPAGQLLDRMIEAMGLQRSQVFLTNVVKCRAPDPRSPDTDEVTSCSPFLYRQLDLIQPNVIVALGSFAAQKLLQTDEKISTLRGRFHSFRGAKVMPTFHPSYLLRSPSAKREVWSDLKLVAQELGIQIPKK